MSSALRTAEALRHLHCHEEVPVLHRDVKSENLLLTEQELPKVADFGTARQDRVSSGKTHKSTKIVVGTMAYMPPGREEYP